MGVTIGDHPDCRGAPVCLDWSYKDLNSTELEKYESERGRRRSMKSLRLSMAVREEMLRAKGFSRADIKDSIISSRKIKRNRKNSYVFADIYDFAYKAERT